MSDPGPNRHGQRQNPPALRARPQHASSLAGPLARSARRHPLPDARRRPLRITGSDAPLPPGKRAANDFASQVDLAPPGVTAIVDRLLKDGLVRRWESREDRRARLVELSPAGRAVANRIQEARAREFDQALQSLTPRTRRRLVGAFEEILAELRTGDAAAPKH